MKNLLYILLFVPLAGFGQEDNLYHIPDTAFLSYLQLYYPAVVVNDSLDIDAASSLYFGEYEMFSIWDENIVNLDGLQFFTSINQLDISGLSIMSIPDLSGLSSLSYLSISYNDALTSIPDLSELTNLGLLGISDNDVLTSIPELSELTNLVALVIHGNDALTSIPELSELTNLSWLFVDITSLTSIPDLSELTNLGRLSISYNDALTSIPDLSGLTNLSELYIDGIDALTSIPELSGLSNLTVLYIGNNAALTSIPELSGLSNLSYLAIEGNNPALCVSNYPQQFLDQLIEYPPVCEVDIMEELSQSFDAWNVTIDLSVGWNMFGYGCPSPIDVIEGFSNHTESIIIVKDNNGAAYIPEWDFNGIGDFSPGFGYQIKVTEAIEDFSLCNWYVNDIPEGYINWLQFRSSQIGCTDNLACNYNSSFIYDDGSCEYAEQGYNCDGILIEEFLIDDFETGLNPDWTIFYQGSLSDVNIVNNNIIQENSFLNIQGSCTWDWLIGMVDIPASAYGSPTFNLNEDANNVYFNMMLNVPENLPNPPILVLQFEEDDNNDGDFNDNTEDRYSVEIDGLDPGWQLISIKYSDLLSLSGPNLIQPNGNGIHNPNLLNMISVLLIANPNNGYSQIHIDYLIFTENGPLFPAPF